MSANIPAAALLFAAGASLVNPLGPDAPPVELTIYLWDPVKHYDGVQWVNGDSTAYTQISIDNKVSVNVTMPPGATSKNYYQHLPLGDVWVRHTKGGITTAWVGAAA